MTAVIALTLVTIATYLLRTSFVTMIPASRFPTRVRAALDDVAPAVMAALVATHLAHGQGVGGIRPTDVIAAVAAAGVAWRTQNLAATCVVGVAAAAVLRLL